MFWIVAGLVLGGLTLLDLKRESTNLMFLFDYFWQRVTKKEHPMLFWSVILTQCVVTLACFVLGFVQILLQS